MDSYYSLFFNPSKALPKLESKTVLVTVSTDGVDWLVARWLADQGRTSWSMGAIVGEQLVDEVRAAGQGLAAFLPADFSPSAPPRCSPRV